MKISDLNIGNQLKIVFSVIIGLILLLGGISWQQSTKMASLTKDLYNHPLMVTNSIGELKSNCISIQRAMKDLCLTNDNSEIAEIIQSIELFNENALKHLEILNNCYLGPASDVESCQQDLIRWKVFRNESIRILQEKNRIEFINRIKPGGGDDEIVNQFQKHLLKIETFAKNKSSQFLISSIQTKDALDRQLGYLVGLILAISFLIISIILKNIKYPLAELTEVSRQFREGNIEVRSSYQSPNEFGILSKSFNDLADTIEKDYLLNLKIATLTNTMLSENDVDKFCYQLLKDILEHTEFVMGTVYLLNDSKSEFELAESIGFNKDTPHCFSANTNEGHFGSAIATRKLQHIKNIDDTTKFRYLTVQGQFLPTDILTIPITSDEETIALISLASISSLSNNSIRLLEMIHGTLCARMIGILAYRKVLTFSHQLENQNNLIENQKLELSKINSYTRSLIEASIDPLVTIGIDGKIMDVNRATELVTGRSSSELIGTDFCNYFTDPEKAKSGYEKVFEESIVRDLELEIKHVDGHLTSVYYNASVYRDNEGKVQGVFAAARDITLRKRAEAELLLLNEKLLERTTTLDEANKELEAQKKELFSQTKELTEQNFELEMQKHQLDEANKQKTIFLSNMSHELRTPLNSVIALSGVLDRRLNGKIPDEELNFLSVIERNGKLLLSLINDILDLSRIESGHEEINIARFDINEVIQEVIDLIEPQALLKEIPVIYQKVPEIPLINSDYDKCRHILQNILSNAIKFTEKGTIEIFLTVGMETLKIAVQDTGIGITKEFLASVFEEFRQEDGSNSRRFGGTGLGMAIAKKYAELLDGSIEVQSTVGVGTTFTLVLPIRSHEISIPREETDSKNLNLYQSFIPAIPASDKRFTILLVEDSEAIIIQMKDILEEEGYDVMIARNGVEALDLVKLKIPDGMILDLMMPEVDGFEVLKRIREEEKTDHLPVIILTAKYVSKEELAFLKHNSIHQLIQKGDINKKQLLDAISKMLRKNTFETISPKTESRIKQTKEHPTILIIEDNQDNMTTIKVLLDEKYEIIEAQDGLIGLQLAKNHLPDVILMDISLPNMNGFEVLKELKKQENLRDIPVIAVTASAMKGSREEIIAAGFNNYVSKPIEVQILSKVLEDWV